MRDPVSQIELEESASNHVYSVLRRTWNKVENRDQIATRSQVLRTVVRKKNSISIVAKKIVAAALARLAVLHE